MEQDISLPSWLLPLVSLGVALLSVRLALRRDGRDDRRELLDRLQLELDACHKAREELAERVDRLEIENARLRSDIDRLNERLTRMILAENTGQPPRRGGL